jgi:hypothetical protein
MFGIGASPFVSKVSVEPDLVLVGGLARIAGVDGADAQRRLEGPRFPDALLRCHEPERESAEREGGYVGLANRCQAGLRLPIEIREGASSQFVVLFGTENHQSGNLATHHRR